MKPVRTWILVADAEAARVIAHPGPGKGLHQIRGKTYCAKTLFEPADQQGRTFSSAHTARHKLEPHLGGEQRESRAFAETLMVELARCHRKGHFDRLILCAAPDMLAHLRKKVPGPMKACVMAEIAKDLTNVPTDSLPRHFEDVLRV